MTEDVDPADLERELAEGPFRDYEVEVSYSSRSGGPMDDITVILVNRNRGGGRRVGPPITDSTVDAVVRHVEDIADITVVEFEKVYPIGTSAGGEFAIFLSNNRTNGYLPATRDETDALVDREDAAVFGSTSEAFDYADAIEMRSDFLAKVEELDSAEGFGELEVRLGYTP